MGLRDSSWAALQNAGVWGYVEVRFLPWVCHCIGSTDGAASMSGTATALFQPLPKKQAQNLREPFRNHACVACRLIFFVVLVLLAHAVGARKRLIWAK